MERALRFKDKESVTFVGIGGLLAVNLVSYVDLAQRTSTVVIVVGDNDVCRHSRKTNDGSIAPTVVRKALCKVVNQWTNEGKVVKVLQVISRTEWDESVGTLNYFLESRFKSHFINYLKLKTLIISLNVHLDDKSCVFCLEKN